MKNPISPRQRRIRKRRLLQMYRKNAWFRRRVIRLHRQREKEDQRKEKTGIRNQRRLERRNQAQSRRETAKLNRTLKRRRRR